ncbi:sensor domain-containing protein [Marinobacterium arenosum]|uniref:sensor domain-containing protein n=1 Tax=Marinobacterium arenosum TaxID=2862496 RepID=UPI001C93A1A9|nr:EAL domain-containing protein [Marinobacterium arenosum]MBY4676157.1 EAL domain-containing protein [Marinobacterium arenosum]
MNLWWLLPTLALLVALLLLWRSHRQLHLTRIREKALQEEKQRLRALIDNVPDLIYVKDSQGRYLDCNRAFAAFLGRERKALIGTSGHLIQPDQQLEAEDDSILNTKVARRVEGWTRYYDGRRVLLESTKLPILGAPGEGDSVLSISRDITRRKHEELLLRMQTSILDRVVRGARLPQVLHELVSLIESDFPDLICSIQLLDRDRRRLVHGAAPSLPEFFNQAVDGLEIGPGVGSCAHAAFTGGFTAVSDIQRHSNWEGLRELAQRAGIAACWSQPISGSNSEVVGVFSVYYRDAHEPDELHIDLIQAAARLTSLALERQQAEENLQKLSRAVDQSPSMVLITDAKGTIEYVNEEFTEVTGFQPQEVIGADPRVINSGLSDPEMFRHMWQTVSSGEDWHGELLNRTKDGQHFWAALSISPIVNETGEITHYVAISEDITEKKQTQKQIERLAFYDPLTSLGNRRLFREQLDVELRKLKRNNSRLGMLYLDLDNFKQVNDSQGHDVGDQLLRQVGKRLRQSLRESDIIARLGGDEFVVLVPDAPSAEGVGQVASKLVDALVAPYQLEGHTANVTASVGITMAPDDGRDASELMKNADLAMYRAKQSGRNTYRFFTADMNDEVMKRSYMEQEVHTGLAEGQFVLHFQPQWSLLGELRLTGVEALVRWNHPQRGWISPADFIPMAEELGLIVPLGEWVIQEACRAGQELKRQGHDVRVAVNLSLRQFRDPNLLSCIRQALAETGLEPQRLELELTESMIMENIDRVLATLQQFKELGITLSIDDFGTGYSSLNYLKKLPVDQLKVDSSFVRDIPHDRSDMEITAAVIAMAHKLGLEVIAEGIETHDQLSFLRQNGCEMGQGYLLAKPGPLAEVLELLEFELTE